MAAAVVVVDLNSFCRRRRPRRRPERLASAQGTAFIVTTSTARKFHLTSWRTDGRTATAGGVGDEEYERRTYECRRVRRKYESGCKWRHCSVARRTNRARRSLTGRRRIASPQFCYSARTASCQRPRANSTTSTCRGFFTEHVLEQGEVRGASSEAGAAAVWYRLVSDSITSISCGFVVELVVQHVVRQVEANGVRHLCGGADCELQ